MMKHLFTRFSLLFEGCANFMKKNRHVSALLAAFMVMTPSAFGFTAEYFPEEKNEIPCFEVVIENINVYDQIECGDGDAGFSLLIADGNYSQSPSEYRVELKRQGKPTLIYEGFKDNKMVIEGLYPGDYEVRVVRMKDECASGFESLRIGSACIDLDIRTPTSCGDGKVTYTNCEGFTVHIPYDLLEPDAYFFVDDDFAGCMAYVNENCEIQPSTRVYCADYILDVPFWLYTYNDDDPNDGIPTVTLIHKYLRQDIGFTDLQAARTNYAMCNAGDDYTPSEINDAIWGILGQLDDFEVPCNTLCSAAKEAVPEDTDVAGAVGTLTYYKSLDPNKQDFVQQVAEANCIDCFPKQIECYSKIDDNEFLEGCDLVVCERSTIVLDPRPMELDNWTWTGPNGFTANTRQVVLSNVVPEMSGMYTVSYQEDPNCFGGTEFTLFIAVMPEPNVEVEKEDAACGKNNGSITFTFPDDPLQTNIEFSIDGGATYPMNVSDDQGSASFDNLPPGTYETLARWGNDDCPIYLGAFEIVDTPGPSLQVSEDVFICAGDSAALQASPSGGTEPYAYVWSIGDNVIDENGESITVTPAETTIYSVRVIDAKGCEVKDDIVVRLSETPLEAMASTISNISCAGVAGGSVEVMATGGEPPYLYEWNTGDMMNVVEGLEAGEYTVTVTDREGCTAVATTVIAEPEMLMVAIIDQEPVLCKGDATGSARASASGGSPPYSYTWSNDRKGDINTDLTAGKYSVTVVDNGGCTAVAEITIAEPETELTATIGEMTMVSCANNVGSATVEASGSTPPYTYEWSNGETTATATQLPAGTHTVTVTDVNGCTAEAMATIVSMEGLTIDVMEVVDVDCAEDMTGSITVRGQGGTAPYLYSWSNGASSATILNLSAGEYCLTLTDAEGCTAETCVTVSGADNIVATIENVTDVSCQGDQNGQIDLSVTGGTAPYTFAWSNGATTEDLDEIAGGEYSVMITDANGCSTETTVKVNEPEALVASISSSSATSCADMQNGSATAMAMGGTAPYNFVWSNGDEGQEVEGLASGEYTVLVTDANGCTAEANVVIDNPSSLEAEAFIETEIDCAGSDNGLAGVEVSGGTVPYVYNWSNGATTNLINELAAGNYTVTVTDANGCTQTATISLSEPTHLAIDFRNSISVSCANDANGKAEVTIEGGTPPYTYEWDNGGTTSALENLGAGEYAVTATDARGCVITGSVVLEAPEPMQVNIVSSSEMVCSGEAAGNIMVDAMGGTEPYSYQWSNGLTDSNVSGLMAGQYTVTATDSKGCTAITDVTISESAMVEASVLEAVDVKCGTTNTGSITIEGEGGVGPYTYAWSNGETTASIDSLEAGDYTVTITDVNGCEAETTVSIASSGEGITAIVTNVIDVACKGEASGSAQISASEGVEPYSFVWSNGSEEAVADGLTAGEYTVTVTDVNGCEAIQSVTISEPESVLDFTMTGSTDVLCKGESTGSITVEAVGGTSPYTYLWEDGRAFPTHGDLAAGEYGVTITDANDCEIVASFIIEEPEEALQASVQASDISCFGENDGSMEAFVSGGQSPYTFEWSNGATTQTITDLGPGDYEVTVTDANGCSTVTLSTLTDATPIEISAIPSNISCRGEADGSISVEVQGGTPPYTYLWSNSLAEKDLSGLIGGEYTLTVTDANGCIANLMVPVNEPDHKFELAKLWWGIEEDCQGNNVGSAMAKVKGGTPPYTYLWTKKTEYFSSEASITDLGSGDYYCTITDANGCEVTGHLCLVVPEKYYEGGTIGDDQLVCSASNDPGMIWGYQPAFEYADDSEYISYAWLKSTTECVNENANRTTLKWEYIQGAHGESYDPGPITTTTYFVRHAKMGGIVEASNIVKVEYVEAPVVDAGYHEFTCEGEETTLNASAYGGEGTYTFEWSHGLGEGASKVVAPMENTIYTVSVTDGMGCTVEDQVEVIVRPGPNLTIRAAGGFTGPFCDNEMVNLGVETRNNTLSALWSTEGDGTFTVTEGLNTSYAFGPNDIANGSVKILATTAGYVGSCSAVTKEIVLTTLPGGDASCVSGLLAVEEIGSNTASNSDLEGEEKVKENNSGGGSASNAGQSSNENNSNPASANAVGGTYELRLFQNSPNPFMTDTKITFELPERDQVRLVVRDMAGQVLRTIANEYEAGRHEIRLMRGDLPYGVLYYSIDYRGERIIKRMLILE